MNDNYFSYDNIGEIADFDSHLEFATRMIDKYQWKKSVKDDLLKRIDSIRMKQKDKQLNISVVGEFSTGKSTFINALMRKELLTACSLQGTTVAETVLEYSPKFEIGMEYSNGRRKRYKFDDFDALRTCLEEYTSEPGKARKIRIVRVYLPSPQLESGFRIIDTPGTNSIDLWHEKVTRRAISETSDLSIILIDANKPMPETFCNFVRQNLSYVLPQCIFVVTKLDLVRGKERGRVMQYIEVMLQQTFGLKEPLVLPYASLEVLDNFNGIEKGDGSSGLLEQSYESEKKILEYAGKYRVLAQAKKLIALIGTMYDSISEQMLGLTKGHQEELALLQRSKQADLSSFIEEQKNERIESFKSQLEEGLDELKNIFYEEAGESGVRYNAIISMIDEQSSAERLKECIEEIPEHCSIAAEELIEISKEIYPTLYECFEEEMALFQGEFEKVFRDMDILSIELESQTFTPPEQPALAASDFTVAISYVAEQIKKENRIFGGGAAAGALIGTAVAPVIGTVAGAFLGLIAGAFGSDVINPDLGTIKKDTKEKVRAPLLNYFDKVVRTIIGSIEDYGRELRASIPEEIGKYLTTYSQEVDRRIALEETKKASIEKKLEEIKKDMKEIENRKFRLDSINTQFDSMNRRRKNK